MPRLARPSKRYCRRVLLLVGTMVAGAIISLSACGTPAGVDPDACGDNVQLRVSAGLTPEVSWTPNCTAHQLVIDSAPAPPPSSLAHFVWFLDSSPGDLGLPAN